MKRFNYRGDRVFYPLVRMTVKRRIEQCESTRPARIVLALGALFGVFCEYSLSA